MNDDLYTRDLPVPQFVLVESLAKEILEVFIRVRLKKVFNM